MARNACRRWLILAVGLFAMLLGGPVAFAQEPRFDGVTLRVGAFGGSWRDALHDLIGKELERRGAKVEYVVGNPRDNLAKLIAARGRDVPFDVMDIDDQAKPQILQGQFLEELNFANLPNARDLEPNQRDRFSIVASLIEEGIIYNTKKFAELGIPRPERFKDLLNPKLAGRVSFPDINVGTVANGIVGFSVEGGGDEGNIAPGLELIKQLKVASFYKSSVELATQFNAGDVWAAWWHAGWVVRLRKGGVPAGISFPTVKGKVGMLQLNGAGIIKGTKVRAAAEFYVNRFLDPEVQLAFAKRLGVAPVNKAALARLSADPELKDHMLLTPAQIQKMYFIDWSKVNMAEWVNRWSRVLAR